MIAKYDNRAKQQEVPTKIYTDVKQGNTPTRFTVPKA